MKTVGFIKEYDEGFRDAQPLAKYLGSEIMGEGLLKSVLDYLDQGKAFEGIMSGLTDLDDDEKVIGSCEYFTDGKWIWVSYLPYYLKKHPNFQLDEEFISDLRGRNFEMPEVSKEQEKEAYSYFREFIFV